MAISNTRKEFNAAFSQAAKEGKKTFQFQGKSIKVEFAPPKTGSNRGDRSNEKRANTRSSDGTTLREYQGMNIQNKKELNDYGTISGANLRTRENIVDQNYQSTADAKANATGKLMINSSNVKSKKDTLRQQGLNKRNAANKKVLQQLKYDRSNQDKRTLTGANQRATGMAIEKQATALKNKTRLGVYNQNKPNPALKNLIKKILPKKK